MSKEPKEYLSVRESGRRGGVATRATHGREHYVEIGRKGGLTTQARAKEALEKEE